MSRDLPPNPNLEHLKKQAKALLEQLRQANTAATLVDAQHQLAREYGFPSWPKLKAHIESRDAGSGTRDPIEWLAAGVRDSGRGIRSRGSRAEVPDPTCGLRWECPGDAA